ncbi:MULTISPECIES: aspartyl-phosphate phosphatase Spo0E family protein [Cytobacillus]|uniref:Aspartyl-phosphate phosphatase Spo0E family protein n=1 Tax=Cytobacillus stercorigallinarum TaxID=2762240 RepID=A0ABR8QQN3_9BACI|nr:aspartyl-phosphate phosphatase Spo0E family protein [Cytobacillus stercorigallinarum]MBD7937839.1 aspartyl-phosphate phosphatase Spo0E family protein [Cytobacillus stercorigallinarum]
MQVTFIDIESQIKDTREMLLIIGDIFGLSDPFTIQISEELDHLINLVQKEKYTVNK